MNVLCNLSPEGFINIFYRCLVSILFISMIFGRIQTIYVLYYIKVNQHCWPQVKALYYGIFHNKFLESKLITITSIEKCYQKYSLSIK